jgi:hypothetical protein
MNGIYYVASVIASVTIVGLATAFITGKVLQRRDLKEK